MNETIHTILEHRSIRLYEDKPLTQEQINLIIQSAQAAPTSSFVQAYSIIGIKNPAVKSKLAELSGNQPYVRQNGHLLVFCLDLHRLEAASRLEEVPLVQVETALSSTETFLVGTIDATLAAQNAVIAAESMGLGSVYIGGLRNRLEEVTKLLDIPSRVVPLFALCLGYPAGPSEKKPRLPAASIYHEERYNRNETEESGKLDEYNRTLSAYYKNRTGGGRADRWTEMMAKQLKSPKRLYLKEYLKSQQLPLN
jgi:FMN reductase (NADPH)